MQDLPPDRLFSGAGIYETTLRIPLDTAKLTFKASVSHILRQNCLCSFNM